LFSPKRYYIVRGNRPNMCCECLLEHNPMARRIVTAIFLRSPDIDATLTLKENLCHHPLTGDALETESAGEQIMLRAAP
jgi:hypothetical protein